jgi:hypothetical protein
VARVGLTARRRLMAMAIATAIAIVAAMLAVEAWVRTTWDDQRGRPGFYLSDAVLGQRLAPNYRGWFAGVPVQINALGFRDDRDYTLEKSPKVFRILVLGDSVTFGHGTRSDTTYPILLEQRLRQWKPDVDWQVWNLGVPGYATSQELAYLNRVGERYHPDLVIVGFYPNDLVGNELVRAPSLVRRAESRVQSAMQRWLYSYEFYKRAALTLRWRLFTDEDTRRRLEHLITDEIPLGRKDFSSGDERQELSDVEMFSADDVASFVCEAQPVADSRPADELRARLRAPDPQMTAWLEAVKGFQDLARSGTYRIAFFVNMAPEVCQASDRFFDGGSLPVSDVISEVLGQDVPVTSSVRAFLPTRPSQMPGASGHSIGNANRLKADVLFEFLRDRVLVSQ